MPVWPESFCPLSGSLNETAPENSIRSSMDRGPDKVRRRTTANTRPLSFRMMLSTDNVQVLDDFFETDCFSGAVEFDYTHPRTQEAVKARFTGPPSYQHKSKGFYDVTIALEIMP